MAEYEKKEQILGLLEFCNQLKVEERESATIEKYRRDVRKFLVFVGANSDTMSLTKAIVLEYKSKLQEKYESSSVNSMLAAVNKFLEFVGREDCKVKQVKIQKKTYTQEDKSMTVEEVKILIKRANEMGKIRVAMMIETICGLGLRVSEFSFVTIQAIHKGEIKIHNKGKTRIIPVTKKLGQKLLNYATKCQITKGAVFITKNGKNIDRSNFWKEIKKLCEKAGIDEAKGFPHNFRHLFARCFYELDKDIVGLASILGHSSIETTRGYTIIPYKKFIKKLETIRQLLLE
jgi:Site-specific recombinase XerD